MKIPKIEQRGDIYSLRISYKEAGEYKQVRISNRSKTALKREYLRIIKELQDGSYVKIEEMSMEDMLTKWLEHKRRNVAMGTYIHYRSYVNNHLIPHFGHINVNEMKPSYIQEFYDQLIEDEVLSNQSIVHLHRTLNNAFKKAIEWEWAIKNPANVIKPPKPEKYEMKTWDEFEVQEFLKISQDDRFYIVYLLALTTGMRKGEILGLRWQDIDINNQILSVRQAITRERVGGYGVGKLKTDKSYRSISLFDHVIKELTEYRSLQRKYIMKHRKTFNDQGFVIADLNGSFIWPRNLDRHWYDLLQKSALKKIRFHEMRHTHATLLLKQGVHPKVVQERLGHSSINITLDTYSHVIPNIQKAAAEQFGVQLFGDRQSK
ncbi:site-specific integrase [Pullulanibacillus camelliae]|uniref:Site-specific integrase n=1 Tax=Pullulanibacillus camelliae TaxID=1707096 RepID=A0A8J2YJE5_9BACL|nr:tyrosine-type recombinase/integrase [Pullulanibacillus camelliae]GGE48032.1 site-specific integrase [Pullulanibacillus camelliae]